MPLWAQNPIVPNQGLNDPHIHIFNDTAYVYASHDKSVENTSFVMEEWWVWSSPDLVNWTQRSVLKPEDTYIGNDFAGCWATDVGRKGGKYYWYFSERNQQAGVVVGNSPTGPWIDPLGKPLLDSSLTTTHEYDIAIYEEAGEHYIIFGVWDYYIARLGDDMVSLAEEPHKITIKKPRGPYNQDGDNLERPTDDKPFLHRYNGKYYLSWGCFYAMSDELYGPYDYVGSVIHAESFAPGYDSPTWPNGFLQGRHGSFFEWNNQWYYAYCDISQSGNRYFRDTFISYIHYHADGTMAPIRVDGVGVGRYEADQGRIEAEDYFRTDRFIKVETDSGFAVQLATPQGALFYPAIEGLDRFTYINLHLILPEPGNASEDTAELGTTVLEIRRDTPTGKLVAAGQVTTGATGERTLKLKLAPLANQETLVICAKTGASPPFAIDAFSFTNH
ncbi:MAG: family 43 glycosylhydrolase [Bacteroidota bacterium]